MTRCTFRMMSAMSVYRDHRILPPRILWACNPDMITGSSYSDNPIAIVPLLSRARHQIESRVVVVVRKLPWMRCSQCQQAVASERTWSFGFVVVNAAGIDTKRVRQQTEHQRHQRNTPSIGHDQKDGSCGGLLLWTLYPIT